MGLRSDWVAAKARAKKFNNNKAIPFKKNLNLGSALDKLDAAQKAYDKKSSDLGPEWAKLADAWVAAAVKVTVIAETYRRELKKLEINDMARREMDTHIVFKILQTTGAATKEGKRLEPLLKKHRKK